jgi:hypothetical protein
MNSDPGAYQNTMIWLGSRRGERLRTRRGGAKKGTISNNSAALPEFRLEQIGQRLCVPVELLSNITDGCSAGVTKRLTIPTYSLAGFLNS